MENTENASNDIFGNNVKSYPLNDYSIPSLNTSPRTQSSSLNSDPSSTKSSYYYTFIIIGIIIVLLAFIGINVFIFLAKGLEGFSDIFKPIVLYILALIGYTGKQVVNTTEEGVDTVVNFTTGAIKGGIDSVKNQNNSLNQDNNVEYPENNNINNNLKNEDINGGYQPDDSSSNIQKRNKTGYCYIGEDEGIRSCAYVGPNDYCMSGDIFPTMDVCVNPNLRS